MGQRNATYVIVQQGKAKTILPIYNQWNHIKLQPSKMVRGIKAVLDFDWRYNRISIIPLVYYAAAGKNDKEWVGGIIESEMYRNYDYTGAFQEDNNNGWNIVKFTLDNDSKVKVSIFCKVGSGDEDDASSETIDSYFYEYLNKSDIDYLRKFKWDASLEKEAEETIKALIDKRTTDFAL